MNQYRSTENDSAGGTAIKFWAAFGLLWAALYAYVGLSWVSGPYFKRVPVGPTPIPDWMVTIFNIYIPIGVAGYLFCFYWFVIRARLRSGQWSSDSLLFVVFTLLVFQDPMINYWQPVFTFNAYFWNMGSWVGEIPGWQSIVAGEDGRTQAYPLLFIMPLYGYALFTFTIAFTWMMRLIKARFPQINNVALVFIAWFAATVVAAVLEGSWLRLGFYGYWSGHPSWTLFHGHYYQLPLYESLLLGAWWTAFSSMRYFINDRGENIFERGLSQLSVGDGMRTVMRFFALLAGGSCIYMASYNIPWWGFSLGAHEWPRDVQERSYFTNFICGPGTDQACPSRSMPLSKRGAVHFDPQGNLIVPEGVAPPGSETVDDFVTGKTTAESVSKTTTK